MQAGRQVEGPGGAGERRSRARPGERAPAGAPLRQSRAEEVRALQHRVGNRATARLLGGDTAAARGPAARLASPAREPSAAVQRVFSVTDLDGQVHADPTDTSLISEAAMGIKEHLAAIERADDMDFNGVYGNYLENSGVFRAYAEELYASSRDLGMLDMRDEADAIRLYFALKGLVMRDVVEPLGVAAMKQEHPDWAPAVAGIGQDQDDAGKLATLIGNIRQNAMGWTYTAASQDWSLAGDCGSLVRTFKAIANNYLHVTPAVTTGFHNGGNGWFVPAGHLIIAGNKIPNVAGGAWYYKTSHVWAEWSGGVYDVLFGEAQQNGSQPAAGAYDRDNVWHFQVGPQWYRADANIANTYVKSGAPRLR
jgi:hypothetical protein